MSAVQRAARKPFKLVAPIVREHPIQKQICDVLRLEIAPPGKVSRRGVCWWAIDHANFAGEVPGIRIGRGIIAGILDTFILYAGRAYFVEIKAEDGVMSEAQQSVASAVLASRGQVGVARSADEMLALLDAWNIPRKGLIRRASVA
jgi:hypothetical protein